MEHQPFVTHRAGKLVRWRGRVYEVIGALALSRGVLRVTVRLGPAPDGDVVDWDPRLY